MDSLFDISLKSFAVSIQALGDFLYLSGSQGTIKNLLPITLLNSIVFEKL